MTRFDDTTLDAAAELLERMAGNTIYQAAWRAGAKRIRALKVLKDNGEVLKDSGNQITTTFNAR
jgi:hypothetical protein